MDQKTPPQGNSDQDILERLRSRYQRAEQGWSEIYREAEDDIKFFNGEQWEYDVKTARQQEKRPCLTINRMGEAVRQVTNEQRQNRPALKVNPVDDEATIETAEVIQGMMRHIEYESNAEAAYDTASDQQCRGGFGFYRLVTEYVDEMSFEQKICIKRIDNQFRVKLDPDYTEADACDMNFGFVIEELSPEQYKRQYPNSEAGQMQDWGGLESHSGGWLQKDNVRVAEYYEKQYSKKKIFLMSDGESVDASEINAKNVDEYRQIDPSGMRPHIVDERETEVCKVMWYKTNGLEILDRTEIHGTYIPIIPVFGEEVIVSGKRVYKSVIRDAKDPQRMLNYWETAKTETIALAPRAPFVGVEGQFEGFEDVWRSANTRSHAYMQYRNVTLGNGQPAPAPQRQTYEPPIQAISSALVMSIEHIKATTGVYDATVGNDSQEISGKAIERRVNQSNITNFHFGDNAKRGQRLAGKIMLQWIPMVYSTAQAVRILHPDGTQKIVAINQEFQEFGERKAHYLAKGSYDVTVDTGPSYQTKRQEATSAMLEMTKAVPDSMKLALDVLISQMDWPESQKIAARIRKTLPPGIAEPDPKDNIQMPPQAQQAIAQLQGTLQQANQLLAQQHQIINTKSLELESRERIDLQKMRNELVIEMMKHDMKNAQIAYTSEVDMIQQRLKMLHEKQMIVNQPSDGPETGASGGNGNQPPGG